MLLRQLQIPCSQVTLWTTCKNYETSSTARRQTLTPTCSSDLLCLLPRTHTFCNEGEFEKALAFTMRAPPRKQ